MSKQLSKAELRQCKPARAAFLQMPRTPIYVLLDGLQSAQNVGMILRVCDALLIQKVYLCGDTPAPPNAKLRRAARGMQNWVNWEHCERTGKVLRDLKRRGVCIAAAEIADDSVLYTRFTPPFPVCLVLGNEDAGVSPTALSLADAVIHLPVLGMCNSLNVSGTAHVLLYHWFSAYQAAR